MPDLVANIPRRRGNRNKPKDTKWRQQKLPAYRPLLTAACAIPITLIGGLIFTALGILLLIAANNAKKTEIDYTNCLAENHSIISGGLTFTPYQCQYTIIFEENHTGSVMFQYGLDKFYQNSRMYVRSRNDMQLFGKVNETMECEPLAKANDSNGHEVAIAPCGSIANSMFNDTFALYYLNPNGDKIQVPFSTENVTWKGERERKFKNPPYSAANGETLCDAFIGTVKPPSWAQSICMLGNAEDGWGFENIDFIVWMKTAALPKFRKNYRSLNKTGIFSNGLPQGNYTLVINYNYPAADFKARKRFVISEESAVGPKNNFLGIAYMAFGLALFLTSALCLVLHFRQRVHFQ